MTGSVPTEEGQLPGPTPRQRRGLLRLTLRHTVRHRAGAIGLALVGFWLLLAIAAPLIAPVEPNAQHAGRILEPPGTPGFLLGTDHLGRDILSRVIYSARVSLGVSVIAVGCGAVIGTVLGLFAGYVGSIADATLMRLVDILLAYPGILLGVVVVAIMGPGVLSIGVAIGVIVIPIFARLARSTVLNEKELEYVAAARLLGCHWYRTMFRHILPNSLGPAVVQFSISVAQAVLIESALSFLGLGAQRPTASWGSMLDASRQYMSLSPTFALFPGIALASLLLGLNFLADGLRKAMDPFRGGDS